MAPTFSRGYMTIAQDVERAPFVDANFVADRGGAPNQVIANRSIVGHPQVLASRQYQLAGLAGTLGSDNVVNPQKRSANPQIDLRICGGLYQTFSLFRSREIVSSEKPLGTVAPL